MCREARRYSGRTDFRSASHGCGGSGSHTLLICPLEERFRLIAAAGAKRIFVLPISPEVGSLSAEEFVSQFLVEAFEIKAVL